MPCTSVRRRRLRFPNSVSQKICIIGDSIGVSLKRFGEFLYDFCFDCVESGGADRAVGYLLPLRLQILVRLSAD